jgi:hypothetical protein
MKIITSLLIAGCMALAGAAFAQQPETQESPAKKKGEAEKTEHATPARGHEMKPNANAAETGAKPHGAKAEHGAKAQTAVNAEASPAAGANAAPQQPAASKKGRHAAKPTVNAAPEAGAATSPGAPQPMEHGKKGAKTRGEAAAKAPPTSPAPAAGAATGAAPAAGATSATGAAGANAAMTKEQGTVGRAGKKVEQAQVQQIKQQHTTFKAQPRPDKAPAVTFNANYRIEAAQSWQGPQYEVFRTYHPEWHDQGWYRQRYTRVELIGGGYYYFNNGYWYPAWGFDSAAAYYPYDGPIYVGHRAEPPDRVIADVQAELQQMGYYQGEVDGLVGPLTRQALRDYQADHGLTVTEAIDEPTLDALQLS